MADKAEIVPKGGWEIAQQERGLARRHDTLSIQELVDQVALIQHAMKSVMKEATEKEPDGHYGQIPGVKKKVLLKAGAEKLCLLFRLDPQYESVELWDDRHLTVKSKCTLYHISTQDRLGSGEGSCSTKESKYAYRSGSRVCPNCAAETIFKSKHPPRARPHDKPGWFCWASKGGCGSEFQHDDPKITDQNTDRKPNPDLPDAYNTVLKMANKRALVAAVLNVTAASDIFTQDVEELMTHPRQEQPQPEQHVKRYTREELDALNAQPRKEREEKAPEQPPEEGFGEEPDADPNQPYGAPLTQDQLTVLHAKIGEKAKNLKVTPERIKETLLASYNVKSSKDLGATVWSSVLTTLMRLKTADLLPPAEAAQEVNS